MKQVTTETKCLEYAIVAGPETGAKDNPYGLDVKRSPGLVVQFSKITTDMRRDIVEAWGDEDDFYSICCDDSGDWKIVRVRIIDNCVAFDVVSRKRGYPHSNTPRYLASTVTLYHPVGVITVDSRRHKSDIIDTYSLDFDYAMRLIPEEHERHVAEIREFRDGVLHSVDALRRTKSGTILKSKIYE